MQTLMQRQARNHSSPCKPQKPCKDNSHAKINKNHSSPCSRLDNLHHAKTQTFPCKGKKPLPRHHAKLPKKQNHFHANPTAKALPMQLSMQKKKKQLIPDTCKGKLRHKKKKALGWATLTCTLKLHFWHGNLSPCILMQR